MINDKERIVELTNKMIRIPSVTGRANEAREVYGIVDEFLSEEISSGLIVARTFENQGVVSQIWGHPDGLFTPRLLLCGHIDVVKEDSEEQYVPKVKDGRIYGRGTGDMKGADAAMVLAYKHQLTDGGSKNVGLLFTSDEETGGFAGARYLIENEGLRPEIVFIPDGEKAPTKEVQFRIIDSQKAPHHFRVIATSTGGHASRAFEIENPVNKIIDAYSKIREKFNLASKENDWASSFEMTGIVSPAIEIFNPETGKNIKNHKEAKRFDVKALYRDRERSEKILATLVNGMFLSANKIPSTAQAWFCWRWPLEQVPFEKGITQIKEIFAQNGCQLVGDEHGGGEGCLIDDAGDPFVTKWRSIIEELLQREVSFGKMHGATDGRHFYKYGAKVLVTSAMSDNAHAKDEWVGIDSLVTLAEALRRYQKEMIK